MTNRPISIPKELLSEGLELNFSIEQSHNSLLMPFICWKEDYLLEKYPFGLFNNILHQTANI